MIKAAGMVLVLAAFFLPVSSRVTATHEQIRKTAPQEQGTYVYTNNDNDYPEGGLNSVTAFSVGASGALTKIGDFSTGGQGYGGGFFGASRIVVCAASNRLYVTNDWSNDITGFNINPATGALSIVFGSPFPSGVPYIGTAFIGISLACTPDGKFLMVGNAGNLAVLSIGPDGSLTPIPSSPFGYFHSKILGMKVTADGKYLVVGSAPGFQVFSIAAGGTLTLAGSASATGGIGIDINCAGTLGYGAIPQSANTRVAGCSIGTNGVPALLPGSPFTGSGGSQEFSTAVVLSVDERFVFVSNPGSSANPPNYTMTVFAVNGAGGLTESSNVAFQSGHDGRHIGLATNAAGTLLFAAELNRGIVGDGVGVYNVAANGVLTEVDGSPFPILISTSFSGLESLAVFPLRTCCPYALSATEEYFPETGGSGTIDVTAPAGCAWTVTSNDSWITLVTETNCSGVDTVGYEVRDNFSNSYRTGTITIAGQTYTVHQSGACECTLSSYSKSFTSGGGTSSVSVSATAGCSWSSSSEVPWITITPPGTGEGVGAINYTVAPNTGPTRVGTIIIAGDTFTVKQKKL